MPIHTEALYKAAVMLAEVEEMRVTVTNTFAASAITALAGTSGFLLLGPAGILVGSTLAGLGAYSYTKNKFKPVFVILKEDLRPQQQQELFELLREAFKDVDHMDFVKLSMLLMNKQELWARMRDLLRSYVLEYFMKALAANNVKVEVKQMTDLERYQKFMEEFNRQNGLPRAARPPAGAPGWRSEIAGSTPDITLRPAAAAEAVVSQRSPAATAEVTAPASLLTPAAQTNQPTVLAYASGNWNDSQPSEEATLLHSVSKTALKTTF